MPVQISAEFSTNLVTSRSLNQIRNQINRNTGKRLLSNEGPVRKRFTSALFREIPEVAHQRDPAYNKRKMRLVGHTTPNVFSGQMQKQLPASAVVTATASGGRVRLRAPWAGKAKKKRNGKGFAKQGMPEWQRQEFETLSAKERRWMASRMKDDFLEMIEDPKYRRQRAIRRARR